jgi:hypothetical protein
MEPCCRCRFRNGCTVAGTTIVTAPLFIHVSNSLRAAFGSLIVQTVAEKPDVVMLGAYRSRMR